MDWPGLSHSVAVARKWPARVVIAIHFFDRDGADKEGQRKPNLEQAAMDFLQSFNYFIRILAWLISCWCCCRQAAARVST